MEGGKVFGQTFIIAFLASFVSSQLVVMNRCPQNKIDWWKYTMMIPPHLMTNNDTAEFK